MRLTRRGRPGLIGTAARTAVIAGTATAVSGAVSQAARKSAQEPSDAQQADISAPPPTALPDPTTPDAIPSSTSPHSASPNDVIAQLEKLAELKQAGVLSEEELESLKAKVLAG